MKSRCCSRSFGSPEKATPAGLSCVEEQRWRSTTPKRRTPSLLVSTHVNKAQKKPTHIFTAHTHRFPQLFFKGHWLYIWLVCWSVCSTLSWNSEDQTLNKSQRTNSQCQCFPMRNADSYKVSVCAKKVTKMKSHRERERASESVWSSSICALTSPAQQNQTQAVLRSEATLHWCHWCILCNFGRVSCEAQFRPNVCIWRLKSVNICKCPKTEQLCFVPTL